MFVCLLPALYISFELLVVDFQMIQKYVELAGDASAPEASRLRSSALTGHGRASMLPGGPRARPGRGGAGDGAVRRAGVCRVGRVRAGSRPERGAREAWGRVARQR